MTLPKEALTCPKCSASMERGFMIDHTYGKYMVGQWAPGVPQKSFWLGLKLPMGKLPVAAYRCSVCGFVEFYARVDLGAV